jgi:uncharacterized protein (DUF2147 family)
MIKRAFTYIGIAPALILITAFSKPHPFFTADAVTGVWLMETGAGHVQIYKHGDNYLGKIIWLKEPNDPGTGKPLTDKKNTDKVLQARPLLGLINLRNFKYTGNSLWEDGRMYNHEDGKDYSCKIIMKDANTLSVKIYNGTSRAVKVQTWFRVQEVAPN